MKNSQRILNGLVLTAVIFLIATLLGSKINLNINFIPTSFGTHSIMLLLSIIAIVYLKKYVNYKIAFPKFNTLLNPIAVGLLVSIIVNPLMTILTRKLGADVESHPLFLKMNATQVFFFVFIYASIAEEVLFRGFLMNFLSPLKSTVIPFFKRKISLPIIISAIAFGLAHLILFTTGVSWAFLLKVVVFTTILGLFAGYYQEKYNNNIYAILVHMAGNFTGFIAAIFMH
ncbi:CPBP family intramembrane glutamic endopeptidase [Lutibacter sp. B1]|uniref:CPBP family intramembrane glutamic endopeptidase n=1 Tax=Lutibacter sp. B1 TaxID=2725996 RepID=UPI001457585C|nr:type II CAAX endopeptidase family protein [Lutibacter sp. B1]NLP57298.1 CPBP family intramembrane metalloprotease [Lutibacter sp. B1]